jgi:hypothetical protein
MLFSVLALSIAGTRTSAKQWGHNSSFSANSLFRLYITPQEQGVNIAILISLYNQLPAGHSPTQNIQCNNIYHAK